ncbi:MAG: YihY/virulence factor BrkB family protein [Fibrobacterota bacterium]|nr:YihY/virulence factor BrkB family protein [Fibrobacterota bacterium]
MLELIKRLRLYFTLDLWKIRARDLPYPKRHFVKYLKITLLSVRGFRKDLSAIRASALTLYTLLSIVPVTAMFFGIAKGFGLEAKLEVWLLTQFPEQQDAMGQIVIFARRTLDGAKGGLVAGAGVAFLMYTVLKLISNIETSFNDIWSIAKPRSWGRKFSDYLSLTLVGPFLLLGASSLNLYLATLVSRAAEAAPLAVVVGPVARMAMQLGPLLLLWILFAFTYAFLPNTKVRVSSALIGGAVAAILYQVVQSLYISIQVGVSKSNAIYGSFAALPLFLIWLQTSWHIVLMGAEVTHQHQNFETDELADHLPNLCFRAIKRISMGVCAYVADRFLKGEPPQTLERIGEDLHIPSRVLADIVRRLTTAGVLVEVATSVTEDPAYQPAMDPHQTRPSDIIRTLENAGEDLDDKDEKATEKFAAVLNDFEAAIEKHSANRPLSEGTWKA